ncbi:hypothetical protein BGX23_000743 [Mortierella sp. AD031]|nr:hypothetical protein BGX23_000743 [Mortierella sp. AD031]KAG0200918.1 hypothetical protein BGX33_010710 [Mortierella sp. NVP41]
MNTLAITTLSKVGPSTNHLHDHHHRHHAPPPPPVPPAPPARTLQCSICFDDFEWFSLKDLNGYQEDPKGNSSTAALSLLPQFCRRPFHIFCSHARGQTSRARQGRVRWTSALFNSSLRRSRREQQTNQKLKLVAAAAESVEALKLGCSLHTKGGSSKKEHNNHAYCLECLARYVDTQVKAQAWPITCPHESCREVVSSFAVETLLGSGAFQWHRLAVEHAIQKKIYCPYNACGRLIDGDRNDEQEAVDLPCPYCSKLFCAMCHGEAHKGINCEQRLDKIFANLATDSNWKSCPSCNHMIEKESGCNHMTCRCGTEFCYTCGSNGWPCRSRH